MQLTANMSTLIEDMFKFDEHSLHLILCAVACLLLLERFLFG
jgi:hypothetical protein